MKLADIVRRRSWYTYPLAMLLVTPLPANLIAAYPRSGSTWLRTMLVNVIYPEANSNPEIFNRFIPGISITHFLHAYTSKIEPRIFSTHSQYYRGLKRRTVYVLRDGRDSVLSLFRYSTTRMGIEMDFDDWFQQYTCGHVRWDEHVKSWLTIGQSTLQDDLLVVRYEDLRKDTFFELKRVCEFLNIGCSKEVLNNSIENASVANMKKWERNTLGEPASENASFYRGGESNEWVSLLTEEQRQRFLARHSDVLLLAGFDLNKKE